MRPLLRLALPVVISILTAAPVRGQTVPDLEAGIKPYASLHGGEFDQVNLLNGNLMLHIPLLSYPQKGSLNLNFWLQLNSINWELQPAQRANPNVTYPIVYLPAQYKWRGNGLTVAWNGDFGFQGGNYTVDDQNPMAIPDVLTDSMGAVHQFAQFVTNSGQYLGVAGDGSGYELIGGSGDTSGSEFSVLDRKGVRYDYSNGQSGSGFTIAITDPFGNQITRQEANAQNVPTGWTDSTGRHIPDGVVTPIQDPIVNQPGRAHPYSTQFIPGTPTQNTSGCPAGTAQASSWTVPAFAGIATYLFCLKSITLQTHFNYQYTEPNTGSHEFTAAEGSGTVTLLTAVVLPNGQTWQFAYDAYGQVNQVVLPTGGTISYDWGDYAEQNTGIAHTYISGRHLKDSNGNNLGDWTYSGYFNAFQLGSVITVRGPAPDNNETVHAFSGDGSGIENLTKWYQGPASSGILLKTESTNHDDFGDGQTYTAGIPTSKTTTLTGTPSSQQTMTYDTIQAYIGGQNTVTIPIEQNKVVNYYDYGTTAPTRTVSTSLQWRNDPAYFQANMLDLPASVVTTDSAGNTIAATSYMYDESTYSPFPNKVGLQTTASEQITPGAFISDHMGWNSSGMKSYEVDARRNAGDPSTNVNFMGHTKDFAYGLCNGSVLTDTFNALNHHLSGTYDCNTGLLSTLTDENGQQSRYSYDTLGRIISVANADALAISSNARSVVFSYDDANLKLTHSTYLSPTNAVTKVYAFDSLGRQKQMSDISDPQGTTYADTTYDSSGRVLCTSNPYRLTTDSTYGNTCTNSYDGLNRPLIVTKADGNRLQYSYIGNATTSLDEAGNSWTRTSDAFGHLTHVTEPTGLNTSYLYSSLGNLLSVYQQGTATETPRTRSFTYDSLSRLLTSTNPETGTICYGQRSGGGTCTGGYDAKGNLKAKTDANGSTVNYTYDALNRLTSKTAPDAGNTNFFYHYDEGTNGIGHLTWEGNPGTAATDFVYDALGRVKHTDWLNLAIGTGAPGMDVRYDLAGNPTQLTYPDGRTLTQTYDSAGRLASVTDIAPGAPAVSYFSGPQYFPSGALQSATYGNGVTQTWGLNSRLQPCAESASLPGAIAPFFQRQLFYASTPESNCGAAANNNGNIAHVLEGPSLGTGQDFTYDNLNRLLSANSTNRPAATTYNQSYGYDSFGNMLPTDHNNTSPNFSIDNATNRLLLNNTDYTYDPAGQLIAAPGHSMWYTAEGYLRSIDNYYTGSYLYNGLGERTLSVQNNATSFQYVYLNGQPMADMDNNNHWTDNIYANGQKIARVKQQVNAYRFWGLHVGWHMAFGVSTSFSNVGAISQVLGTITNGDQLSFDIRMPVQGTVGGLYMAVNGNVGLSSTTVAESSQYSPPSTAWQHLTFDLSQHQGTLTDMGLNMSNATCWCGWEIDVANLVITRADGSVVPILTNNSITSATYLGALADGSNQDAGGSESLNGATEPISADATEATNYYLADQLGTTQMELSSSGTVLWQGAFTPFGQEIVNGYAPSYFGQQPTDGTSNRYKFTGKERDTESGLDYFGARYYASNMGRWMSPDWADKPEAVPYSSLDNPQSLNLYGYVLNNPLSRDDPDGHCCEWAKQKVAQAQQWAKDHPRTMSAVKATGAAIATGAAVVAVVALAPEVAAVATVGAAAEVGLTAAGYGVAASGGAVATTVYATAAITGDKSLDAGAGAVQTITNPAGLSGTILSGGNMETGEKAAAASDVLTGGKDLVSPVDSGVKALGPAATAATHAGGAATAGTAAASLAPSPEKKKE